MRKIHLFTTVGAILVVTAIVLFCLKFFLASSILSVIAYFLAIKEVNKYTSWFQFITVSISSIILGISIEYPFTALSLLTLSLFISACGSIVRIVLFRIFFYTCHSWFEPLMLSLSIALYLIGNILSNHSLNGWVFPLPVIVFNAVLAFGILKDKKQLLGFTKGGYKISIGKSAPDFSLPDQDGYMVNLSDFKSKRDLLLIFVRGDWCPGCHMMLRTYEKEREKFQQKNIIVIAIGPDPVGVNREMVIKLGLDFKVLADEGQKTAMNYGVQLKEYENDFAEKYTEGIPLPASFLIDKTGIVRYVSRPDRVGEFLNPSLIFPILESLS